MALEIVSKLGLGLRLQRFVWALRLLGVGRLPEWFLMLKL